MYPIPPISHPNFPYRYSSTIDKQVKFIQFHLSLVFPSSKSYAALSTHDQHAPSNVHFRESFDILNENVRGQLLQVFTLRRALKEAQAIYAALKAEQREFEARVKTLTLHAPRLPMLPFELVEKICFFACARFRYDPRPITKEEIEAWGSVLYKPVRFPCNSTSLRSQDTQLFISNEGRLHVQLDSDKADDLLWLHKSTLFEMGKWDAVHLRIAPGKSQLAHCANIARVCSPSLATVQHLGISFVDTSRIRSQSVDPVYFQGCLQALSVPVCSSLGIPLALVPCFRHLIPSITNMDVVIAPRITPREFVASFQGVDLRNLRSLNIVDDMNQSIFRSVTLDQSTLGTLLSFPRLQELFISVGMSVGHLLSFLDGIQCPQLEWLDLLCDLKDSDTVSVRELLVDIGSRFKPLRRLSVDRLSSSFWATEGLQREMPDGDVILPNLTHLAVHISASRFDKEIDALVKLLEYRREVGADLVSITLDYNGLRHDDLQRQIEYIGLLVETVYILK